MKSPNHTVNIINIIHYALDDLIYSIWKFVMKRQNRFRYFEH